MSEIGQPALPADTEQGKEVTLVDLLIILAKRKKILLTLPLIAALAAAAISLALPSIYKSGTKILPPQQAQSNASAILSQLGGIAGAAVSGKNPNDLYIAMLKSRVIADILIARFELGKVYQINSLERTRKILELNTLITAGKDGLIGIEVEDQDPKRAASIANAYAEELLKLTRKIAITQASQIRLFFERQLEMSKEKLAESEAALRAGIGARGMISADSESQGMVEMVARLRAQETAKEIQLRAMHSFLTPDNQEYKILQQELTSVRTQLARLENGKQDELSRATPADLRDGLGSMKLLREVKYRQMLYELLAKQYEVARLDESKDASIIQVLDKAEIPEDRFRPRRTSMVMSAALLGFFAALIWILICELLERARRRPGHAEQLQLLRHYFFSK